MLPMFSSPSVIEPFHLKLDSHIEKETYFFFDRNKCIGTKNRFTDKNRHRIEIIGYSKLDENQAINSMIWSDFIFWLIGRSAVAWYLRVQGHKFLYTQIKWQQHELWRQPHSDISLIFFFRLLYKLLWIEWNRSYGFGCVSFFGGWKKTTKPLKYRRIGYFVVRSFIQFVTVVCARLFQTCRGRNRSLRAKIYNTLFHTVCWMNVNVWWFRMYRM